MGQVGLCSKVDSDGEEATTWDNHAAWEGEHLKSEFPDPIFVSGAPFKTFEAFEALVPCRGKCSADLEGEDDEAIWEVDKRKLDFPEPEPAYATPASEFDILPGCHECTCSLEDEEVPLQKPHTQMESYVVRRQSQDPSTPRAIQMRLASNGKSRAPGSQLQQEADVYVRNIMRINNGAKIVSPRIQWLSPRIQPMSSPVLSRANEYRPDPTDDIDLEVKRILWHLDDAVATAMTLRRVQVGMYEIDGRMVCMYWGNRGTDKLLLVHEDEVGGSSDDDYSLSMYLDVVANVLMSRSKSALGKAIVSDMSFVNTGPVIAIADLNGLDDAQDREGAMRVACTQAAMRKALIDPSRPV
jgi:hypothetical protein